MLKVPFWVISLASLFAAPEPCSGWVVGQSAVQQGDKVVFQKGKDALVALSLPGEHDTRLGLELAPGKGRILLTVLSGQTPLGRWILKKDERGESLASQKQIRDAEKKWQDTGLPTTLTFRPRKEAKLAWRHLPLPSPETSPALWSDRVMELRLVSTPDQVEVSLDGVLLGTLPGSGADLLSVSVEAGEGDVLHRREGLSLSDQPLFVPLQTKFFQAADPSGLRDTLTRSGGVPFLTTPGSSLDLRQAQWPMASEHPSNYFADYDSGPMYLHDPRNPTFWAPAADYTFLHLWLEPTGADAKPTSRDFSVRLGTFGHGATGGRLPVVFLDHHASLGKEAGSQVVSIPLTEIFAQDLRGPLQVGLNKTLRLARRSPDPSRFEYRPLGLPVGAKLLGATLQRSPLQIRIEPERAGAVFTGTQTARFRATLHNVSPDPISGTLRVRREPGGTPATAALPFTVAPGSTDVLNIEIPAKTWGHFPVLFIVESEALPHPMKRRTSFALLPPGKRENFAKSPFGTWTFGGGHMTCPDPEILGPLLRQAGLRFGMSRFPEGRKKFGITNNFEAKKIDSPEKFREWQAENPDALPVALLMHEDAISADHVRRIPDAFSERPPYRLSEDEQKRFQKLWDAQKESANILRTHFPNIHLRLGNGALPTKEEFLRAGFPAEYFDSLGNEAGGFGRLPEAQPPDWVGNNASLWMDHKMLEAYGYKDKTVTQCYEITYPSTNPGNLTPEDQASYFVRHALHSTAWRVPEIRFGLLDDVANAYRFSNWGASGLLTAWPHLAPKPSYVAVATMTRELDDATFQSDIPTGSRSTYALRFQRPKDRQLIVLWTLKGRRDALIDVSGGEWTVTDWQGNTTSLTPQEGRLRVHTSSMPVYLAGTGTAEKIALDSPHHDVQPGQGARILSGLDHLEAWQAVPDRDPVLESHNPMRPRRWAAMTFGVEDSAERGRHLRVEGPPPGSSSVLPFYQALEAKPPILIPGEPSEIGLWIEGNSGWGRVIFELKDASGQKWTSIGASRSKEISPWMLDWLPKEFARSTDSPATQADWNTNDVFGLSSICFDGWRYVRFPLPGNYPGEGNPWPANSQWRHDGDGQVRYPLTLTRLIIEFPENVLRLTELVPIQQSLGLKDLTVEYGTQGGVKSGIYEDQP